MDASAIQKGSGRHQDPGPGSTRKPQRPREVVLPESGSTVAPRFPTTANRRVKVESVRTGPGSTRRPRKITREAGVRFGNPRRTVRTRQTVAKCLRVSVACNNPPQMACKCNAHPHNVLLSLSWCCSVAQRPRLAVLPKLPALKRVEDLGQNPARRGHGPQRVCEVLRVEVLHLRCRCSAQRVEGLGPDPAISATAQSMLATSCALKPRRPWPTACSRGLAR